MTLCGRTRRFRWRRPSTGGADPAPYLCECSGRLYRQGIGRSATAGWKPRLWPMASAALRRDRLFGGGRRIRTRGPSAKGKAIGSHSRQALPFRTSPVSGSAFHAAVLASSEEPFAGAGPMVRIRFPPAESRLRTRFLQRRVRGLLFAARQDRLLTDHRERCENGWHRNR